MFEWLKKRFKKEKTEILIELTDNILNDKKIISFWDLYQKVGINAYIEQMIKLNEFNKYHYSNIQANTDTCMKLDKLIRDHLVNTKNRYSKIYKEKVLSNMAAMDSLQWSPKMVDDLPNNTIRIILPNNKKYVEVTKEMLSYDQ